MFLIFSAGPTLLPHFSIDIDPYPCFFPPISLPHFAIDTDPYPLFLPFYFSYYSLSSPVVSPFLSSSLPDHLCIIPSLMHIILLYFAQNALHSLQSYYNIAHSLTQILLFYSVQHTLHSRHSYCDIPPSCFFWHILALPSATISVHSLLPFLLQLIHFDFPHNDY